MPAPVPSKCLVVRARRPRQRGRRTQEVEQARRPGSRSRRRVENEQRVSRCPSPADLRPDGIRVVTMNALPLDGVHRAGLVLRLPPPWTRRRADLEHQGRDPPGGGQATTRASTSRKCSTPRASTPCSAPTRAASRRSRPSTSARSRASPRSTASASGRVRPPRQRRHRGRQRRRLLRRPRGQAGRARRGHPHGPLFPQGPSPRHPSPQAPTIKAADLVRGQLRQRVPPRDELDDQVVVADIAYKDTRAILRP